MDYDNRNNAEINKKEKEYIEVLHEWSEWIYSLNPASIPDEIKWKIRISETDIKKMSTAYFGRLSGGGILINESFPKWEIRRDLFLALDRLPHSLLLDIYKMECERYKGEEPDLEGNEDPGEKIRRLLYLVYIPELIKVHEESNKKHI